MTPHRFVIWVCLGWLGWLDWTCRIQGKDGLVDRLVFRPPFSVIIVPSGDIIEQLL